MNITSHHAVLEALAHRADQFKNKSDIPSADDQAYAQALDKTGTISSAILCKTTELRERMEEIEQQEISRVNETGIPEEILRVHGTAPGEKWEGIIRLVYKNTNGINNRLARNEKVIKARQIHDDPLVDIAAYNKHKLNMQHVKNVNGFNQLFNGGESPIHSVVSHNKHKNVGKIQEGRTSLMIFGALVKLVDQTAVQKDESGLWRWSVITLRNDGITTRIVCGYNPCYNKSKDNGTTHAQHHRYLAKVKKDLTCPRTRFRLDLINQLRKWQGEGDKITICLDANEKYI